LLARIIARQSSFTWQHHRSQYQLLNPHFREPMLSYKFDYFRTFVSPLESFGYHICH
jgi:hypothetical protein